MPPINVAGRSLRDWEPVFRSRIEAHLKIERLDSLVYEISEEDSVESYVIKKKGQNRVVRDQSGTTTFLAPIVTEPATPTKIELTAPVRAWIEDPRIVLDYLFLELAREVAQAETVTVLKALKTSATEFRVTGPLVSRGLLNEVEHWATEHGQYLDTLILHPANEAKLTESREFIGAWLFPEPVRVSEGPHFAGSLAGLTVYWTPFIDQQTLLVYKKMETREKRSRITVKFAPSFDDAEDIMVREDCLAWMVDDTAVALVKLGSEE